MLKIDNCPEIACSILAISQLLWCRLTGKFDIGEVAHMRDYKMVHTDRKATLETRCLHRSTDSM